MKRNNIDGSFFFGNFVRRGYFFNFFKGDLLKKCLVTILDKRFQLLMLLTNSLSIRYAPDLIMYF